MSSRTSPSQLRPVSALLTVTVVGLVALLGLGSGVPHPIAEEMAYFEWSFGWGERVAVVGVVLAFSAVVVVAGWVGLGRDSASVTMAAATVAASWATLAPAIWAEHHLLRAIASIGAGLLPAGLLHLTVVLLEDRGVRSPRWSRAVRAGYGTCVSFGLLIAFSHDPFLDPGCVVRCAPVVPVIPSPDVAALAMAGLRLVWAVVAGAVVVRVGAHAIRLGRAVPMLRWLPVLACAVLDGLWALAPQARPVTGPTPDVTPWLLGARAVAYAAAGVLVLTKLVSRVQRRAAFRRLAQEITELTTSGSVRAVLASRMHDPGADVHFHVRHDDSWVDERGEPVAADDSREGVQTIVVHHGTRPVARMRFRAPDGGFVDHDDLLGPATVLALEAERTRAERLLRLRILRDTRRLEVEVSDDARRRVERDLHDGAQHLLVAATFALQDALSRAKAQGHVEPSATMELADAELRQAADELRAVARGIFPGLLRDAGLLTALEGLAMTSSTPVTVDASAPAELSPAVELTAYQLARMAVAHAEDDEVRIHLSQCGSCLRMDVSGASLEDSARQAILDRAAALGGTMEFTNWTMRLELPCA